ncbi:hypothetical protein NQ318_010833 [Aromia moschata]|uniref:Uncharacterized protein n=1 Tax=Aromia moschata TaxID=1265417 RepID=A0AAV8YIG2_9CUCU|nr:hypothetical protein NQ318_010833 [Aromia moschata]
MPARIRAVIKAKCDVHHGSLVGLIDSATLNRQRRRRRRCGADAGAGLPVDWGLIHVQIGAAGDAHTLDGRESTDLDRPLDMPILYIDPTRDCSDIRRERVRCTNVFGTIDFTKPICVFWMGPDATDKENDWFWQEKGHR